MSQIHQAVRSIALTDWVSQAVASMSAMAVTGGLLMAMAGIAGHQYRDVLAEQATEVKLAQSTAARALSCAPGATTARIGA